MEIIHIHQNKQWDIKTTETQLHMNHAEEKHGLTLYLGQQLRKQLKLSQDQQKYYWGK